MAGLRFQRERILPIFLPDIEVGLNFVDNCTFTLVKFGACTLAGSDMHYEPFLVLPGDDRIEPFSNLGTHGGTVRVIILREEC